MGRTKWIAGNSLCGSHWQQDKRRGDPLAPPLKDPDWTADEDRSRVRIASRSPDPWVPEALGVSRRTYSAWVTRACDLRPGIKKSSAV